MRSPFGLQVSAAALYLDARRAPGLVFVSHAHSDHCSSAKRIVCTPETATLHPRRRAGTEAIPLNFGEQYALGSCTLQLASAGHTLGSAMAIVQTPYGSVAYTGDYKLRPGPFSPVATVPRCDTLVMECTFGHPRYRFPAEAVVLARLFEFIDEAIAGGSVPVVLAYAFGKAQDALYHLTSHGYSVVVDEAAARVCEMHVRLGHSFPGPGSWTKYSAGVEPGEVLLTVPGAFGRDTIRQLARKKVVHLTGWGAGGRFMFRGCDLVLPLSGHADFEELVRTARESGAAKVYTVHGAPRFAAHLRSIGIDAEHLGAQPQSVTRDDTISRESGGAEGRTGVRMHPRSLIAEASVPAQLMLPL